MRADGLATTGVDADYGPLLSSTLPGDELLRRLERDAQDEFIIVVLRTENDVRQVVASQVVEDHSRLVVRANALQPVRVCFTGLDQPCEAHVLTSVVAVLDDGVAGVGGHASSRGLLPLCADGAWLILLVWLHDRRIPEVRSGRIIIRKISS